MSKKRVLFLLGTLEKSKCGVADYTHMLADTLHKEGHTCISVAINDRFLYKIQSSSTCQLDDNLFSYYRFSSNLSWRYRALQLAKILDYFDPSLISLQYVPYSFSDKGLPFQFLQLLKSLETTCEWQVMAHELWIIPKKGILKKLVSLCQRKITLSIFRSISPKVLNVSNYFYQRILSNYGHSASILPLFSNIPYTNPANVVQLSTSCWKFVSFGRLSKDWDYNYFLDRIESARLYFGIKECYFYLLGNCGEYGASIWSMLSEQCTDNYPAFNFIMTGPLSCNQISQHFHFAHFGICSTPIHLVDKSGAVAAMIAHGIPIIVNKSKDNINTNNIFSIYPDRFLILDEHLEKRILTLNPARNAIDQLSTTAKQFISQID